MTLSLKLLIEELLQSELMVSDDLEMHRELIGACKSKYQSFKPSVPWIDRFTIIKILSFGTDLFTWCL